ncbi:DUF523 domain-containing protein [Acidaminobacter sp. JC074]|uniref:DUF523 domain-containing protein n=1 Tax=Acidaminobacter sp. JC074 TaxID=2530199 RepID=UPI001F0DBC16|nr:DUF523 domain-containing protein [Acidaminobacter sp. JC074]MCH4888662.1 DUF523 domain-containing protein [Acidaminobacter sp. JC074]
MILVSSCLLGLSCRYDGKEKADERVINYLKDKAFMPICPEQMGGLTTPRPPAEIVSFQPLKICTEENDVTKAFVRGVDEVMKLVKLQNIEKAILKSKSPSCGTYEIYDGSFTRKLVKGSGIMAKRLMANDIKVINENDLD